MARTDNRIDQERYDATIDDILAAWDDADIQVAVKAVADRASGIIIEQMRRGNEADELIVEAAAELMMVVAMITSGIDPETAFELIERDHELKLSLDDDGDLSVGIEFIEAPDDGLVVNLGSVLTDG